MAAKIDGLLNILEIAMNACCRGHETCGNCRNMASCVDLWSRACQQSAVRSLSPQQLRDYIEEFNRKMSIRSSNFQNTLES